MTLMSETRDIDIRVALHSKKLNAFRGAPNTLVVNELGLSHAKVRIDVAVINGCVHGYEIKSSLDTLNRLPAQLELYSQCLERLTLVKEPKMAKAKKAAKPKAAKKKESVIVSVLIDESGSMTRVCDATIAGFNEYVGTLKTSLKDDDVHFSAITFDTRGIRKLQVGAPIAKAITLSRENYNPNGGTPLLDAVGRTIQATDEVAGKNKASKIIVVIQTDGEENASAEFKLDQIKTMVEERQGKGWEFVFIGAGINAFEAGATMGIQGVNTVSYTQDSVGTAAIFAATACNTAAYTKGLSVGMGYSAQQSRLAGENANITLAKMKVKK